METVGLNSDRGVSGPGGPWLHLGRYRRQRRGNVKEVSIQVSLDRVGGEKRRVDNIAKRKPEIRDVSVCFHNTVNTFKC